MLSRELALEWSLLQAEFPRAAGGAGACSPTAAVPAFPGSLGTWPPAPPTISDPMEYRPGLEPMLLKPPLDKQGGGGSQGSTALPHGPRGAAIRGASASPAAAAGSCDFPSSSSFTRGGSKEQDGDGDNDPEGNLGSNDRISLMHILSQGGLPGGAQRVGEGPIHIGPRAHPPTDDRDAASGLSVSLPGYKFCSSGHAQPSKTFPEPADIPLAGTIVPGIASANVDWAVGRHLPSEQPQDLKQSRGKGGELPSGGRNSSFRDRSAPDMVESAGSIHSRCRDPYGRSVLDWYYPLLMS